MLFLRGKRLGGRLDGIKSDLTRTGQIGRIALKCDSHCGVTELPRICPDGSVGRKWGRIKTPGSNETSACEHQAAYLLRMAGNPNGRAKFPRCSSICPQR